MLLLKISFVFIFLFLVSSSFAQSPKIENGVSEELTNYRKQIISNIHYNISLQIPAQKNESINGSETIHFDLKDASSPLQIDFKEQRDHIKSVSVNDKNADFVFQNEHIVIGSRFLQRGTNTVAINFAAGDLSLNRNNDYLYTLLVPDRARTLFPCFDQPSLKANFQLTLTIPTNWKALTNAPVQDSVMSTDIKTYHYQESDLIPTYLFSFSAGRFERALRDVGGRPMNFYYRETDNTKISLSLDTVFKLHAHALNFLEDYTQIKFPFKKFDFVAIPDFQYGGMEHVGAIDYKASSLFLDAGATRDQENSRANVISHETSHMWFGDLVTMQWFNDVWMKEVFANFMADKITQGGQSSDSYELKFLLTHLPRAYAVDRTGGANPIRQQLNNLQEAGTLYGAIIYDKAPVMMRQLERLMGAEASEMVFVNT